MADSKNPDTAVDPASGFLNSVYKPDVLQCLANLSNDEVFTPPEAANGMLDLLPQELFRNPEITFLDPCCKSGVFLREIAKRLIEGLKDEIPDLQKRLDHIFHKQLYGIAITELTSLLSRRSVYCSKNANSKWSVSNFDVPEGNIIFERIKHTWNKGKCIYCGASQAEYDRNDVLETHAYQFIHPGKVFENMKFDVIIGNPPYQLTTAGSVKSQSTPLYDKFVEKALSLNPRYLSMIIPSRWMTGGFGLDDFRTKMMNDMHIKVLHDYLNANDCFNGISLPGGVCYFLWDHNYQGECNIYTHHEDSHVSFSKRCLLEAGLKTFIRINEAISILNKVKSKGEPSFADIVSQRDPFGLNYYENGTERMFKSFHDNKEKGDCEIYYYGWLKEGVKYVNIKHIQTFKDAIDRYKVFISKANGAASTNPPYSVLSRPFVGQRNTICNMTYLLIGPFDSQAAAENVVTYIQTKFFRFLVSLLKNTQNAYKQVYSYVPMQDFSKPWTDEELYKKYGLTEDEIAFIDSIIRPME